MNPETAELLKHIAAIVGVCFIFWCIVRRP